jgi:hypothetical protein
VVEAEKEGIRESVSVMAYVWKSSPGTTGVLKGHPY